MVNVFVVNVYFMSKSYSATKISFLLVHHGHDVMGVVPFTVNAYPSLPLTAVKFICANPCSKDCEIYIFDLSKSWNEYHHLKYSPYYNYAIQECNLRLHRTRCEKGKHRM